MKRIVCLLFASLFCLAAFSQADKAKYYIEGDYAITQGTNGEFVYQLSNITSKGITFNNTGTIIGKKEADESISFTFDKASTDCPEGFAPGLKFWKWQYDGKNYNWQRDSEVKDAQQEFETDKVMTVVLVLDCSKSLGEENFEKLKNSATKFINILHNASPDGSIRLGIVGFNTMGNTDNMVREIEPLTSSSRDKMTKFIQDLTLYNNTALYYAMRKGADMMSNYVQNLPATDLEKFDYACMVTFTDGFDNHSTDPTIGIPAEGLDNPYFQYVRDNVVNRNINNVNLKSYVIAIKGNDVSEDNKLYKAVFQGISSEEPFLLNDFGQLEAQFENMAQELIKRWQNLTCYVPSAHQGKVRWTLGNDIAETRVVEPVKEEPVVEPEPKAKFQTKNFFGVSAGVETEFAARTNPRWFPIGANLGFDFAIAQPNYGVGGFVSLKYCGPTHVAFGPLFLLGDYENKPTFMLGGGLDLRCVTYRPAKYGARNYDGIFQTIPSSDYIANVNPEDRFGAGGVLRLGMSFPNHLYFYVDLTLGGYKTRYVPTLFADRPAVDVSSQLPEKWRVTYEGDGSYLARYKYMNIALNIGYRFGKRPSEISFKDVKFKN